MDMVGSIDVEAAAGIAVRNFRAGDVAAVTRIYADAVLTGTASFELEPPDESAMAQRQQALGEGNYPWLVAEYDGAVAGYAYAGPFRVRAAYRWSVEDSVYVDPRLYRRGVGRALLSGLIGACEGRGFRQMIAVIGDTPNQTASIELHRAAGFRLVGVLDAVGFKFGRRLDTALMQRALGSNEPLNS
jgi:L-amino acid N-acyltransferase YncA